VSAALKVGNVRSDTASTAFCEERPMEEHENGSETDERTIAEWLEFGFAELGRYLRNHAAFDDFCRRIEPE
jgi:hypothetical protein